MSERASGRAHTRTDENTRTSGRARERESERERARERERVQLTTKPRFPIGSRGRASGQRARRGPRSQLARRAAEGPALAADQLAAPRPRSGCGRDLARRDALGLSIEIEPSREASLRADCGQRVAATVSALRCAGRESHQKWIASESRSLGWIQRRLNATRVSCLESSFYFSSAPPPPPPRSSFAVGVRATRRPLPMFASCFDESLFLFVFPFLFVFVCV